MKGAPFVEQIMVKAFVIVIHHLLNHRQIGMSSL